MSYREQVNRAPSSAGTSSTSDPDDRCSDWASSFGEARRTKSLFDDEFFPTAEAALEHDREVHDFDLVRFAKALGLDIYGRMRLINHVRRQVLSSADVKQLKHEDGVFKDDSLLAPVIPDDPLLQLDFDDDDWTDDGVAGPSTQALDRELEAARKQIAHLQSLVQAAIAPDEEARVKGKGKVGRDDDTHYFDSYAENDIHEIMLKDTTRTVSYGRFILSNPQVFKDAVVMDVGCGTGILSMFAARAGAKHVYAIEASGVADKARENIKRNSLEGIITVIQGKVEDIELPVRTVDVIISEWMGYMLLYESMLDSVLVGRDRFLAPNGLMVPSQTRLVISAITGERLWRERVDFWKGIYGFDMTAMSDVYFDEGLVEVVDADEVVTTESIVRDINSHVATPKSLDFHSAFSLLTTSSETTTVRAFLTHFDTFFSPAGGETSNVPPEVGVDLTRIGDDEFQRPVAPVSDGVAVSFTTGPRGKETHWRQVVFLLREPIVLLPGEGIEGKFYCRKSATNSRELDVEIHFAKAGADPVLRVETYKVR